MADLLKGSSDAVITANVAELRRQGLSEAEAVAEAHRYAGSDEDEDEEYDQDDPIDAEDDSDEVADGDVEDGDGVAPSRQWVVVTKDFSGLGWAKRLLEEGETVTVATDYSGEDDPKARKQMKMVGDGWLDVLPLSEAISKLRTDSTYWLFTENNFPKEADALREQGQKVFGTSVFTDKLEHDRQFGVDTATKCGLKVPTTTEFSSLKEGMAFLDENPETAYVFKPDDGTFNYMTFVSTRKDDSDANRALYEYLSHMKQDPGPFILQERLPQDEILEVNAELWFYEGEPFMATVGLEVKRKNTGDVGEMCGCGGDFMQVIDVHSELIKQTVGKMIPFYREENYTGFADVNVLIAKNGTPYFLEVCNRLGYNAHVTLMLGLAKDPIGDIFADFMDGKVQGMAERFHTDVGASMTLFIDHPREGLPVHVDPAFEKCFYTFDGRKEDDQLLLTGYSDEIGICVGRGSDILHAADAVWDQVVRHEAVHVDDMYYRTDLAKEDYANAPSKRYQQLKNRGLLDT